MLHRRCSRRYSKAPASRSTAKQEHLSQMPYPPRVGCEEAERHPRKILHCPETTSVLCPHALCNCRSNFRARAGEPKGKYKTRTAISPQPKIFGRRNTFHARKVLCFLRYREQDSAGARGHWQFGGVAAVTNVSGTGIPLNRVLCVLALGRVE